jgi:hypothetical protein
MTDHNWKLSDVLYECSIPFLDRYDGAIGKNNTTDGPD